MRRFEASDYHEIAGWYRAHGVDAPTPDALPGLGLIEPGIAVGWLFRTDSSIALIDGLLTNPVASIRERSAAITAIIEALVVEARRAGYHQVVGLTRHAGVQRRTERLGFRPIGRFAMMGKAVATEPSSP